MTTASRLVPGQEAAATRVLAAAFQADPMMVHLMPDPDRRRATLPRFLGSVLRYCARYGEVWTTTGTTGVACWLPPGRTDVPPLRMLRTGVATSVLRLGPAGLGRFGRLVSAMERDHHAQMPSSHWYLWLLATDPAHVRTGVGGAVLAPVLRRADAIGVPAYLDTHREANLQFYARHGFEPVAGEVVDGLRYWGLRREPGATRRA